MNARKTFVYGRAIRNPFLKSWWRSLPLTLYKCLLPGTNEKIGQIWFI